MIPAELILISSTLVAMHGELSLALVFAAGFAGAVLGDTLIYRLGGTVGQPVADHLLADPPQRRRLRWTRGRLCRHGEGLLVASRFVPMGRTAATFAAGMLDFPWRRFLVADALAAAVSVGYLMGIGMIGGHAFAKSFWPSLAVSLAVAGTVVVAIELLRRVRHRERSRHDSAWTTRTL